MPGWGTRVQAAVRGVCAQGGGGSLVQSIRAQVGKEGTHAGRGPGAGRGSSSGGAEGRLPSKENLGVRRVPKRDWGRNSMVTYKGLIK